jgi:hypothetical protein
MVLKPLAGRLLGGGLRLGNRFLNSPFLDVAQDLLFPDPVADDREAAKHAKEVDDALKRAIQQANFKPDLTERPYLARPGTVWEIQFFSPNNLSINNGIIVNYIIAFKTKDLGPDDLRRSPNDILIKMINEGDVNFGANWGVCDSKTIRLKRISRTYPWDLEDVPDLPFPSDLGLGPWDLDDVPDLPFPSDLGLGSLTFYPNSPGEPFIEVDPPRGDPRLPTNQQQPPYPLPPRWRPLGSPRWRPWNDPERPQGLKPDPTSFPPENMPFPEGPNGLNSLPTNFNSNLSLSQPLDESFLPEKCMECRFDPRVIRDIVEAAKKQLLQDLSPSMKVKVYDEKEDKIIEKDLKVLSTPDTKESVQELYGEVAELQIKRAVAAVPEWWQIRAESQRPQLVILFAEQLASGKLTSSRWTLSLPHYNRPKAFKPSIPAYQKGNWEGILTLTDNSKIIVNASSSSECKRVINRLKTYIPVEYRVKNGKAIKAKYGERINSDLRKVKVIPVRASFFSTGARNLAPDWVINLRGK